MVLEDIFRPGWIVNRPYIAFFFGLFFSLFSFVVAWFAFRSSISVSTVFLTTLLLVPAFITLIKNEERVESRSGLRNFFHNHKGIFEVYFFSFLGVFIAFFLLGLVVYPDRAVYSQLFDFQLGFLKMQGVDAGLVQSFLSSGSYGWAHFFSLLSHNLLVLIVCFVLSLFYGASAIFLIILNGSVFAVFLLFISKNLAENFVQGLKAFGFFLIHMLPEISGFLIAAIAGGVVSKALILEKRGKEHFRNVFQDAFVLMLIAVVLIIIAAFLETFVSSALFRAGF